MSASDVLVVLVLQVAMSSLDAFPRSLVLHFPPSVYQKIGASEILPQLLRKFEPDEVRCVQFLRGGKVRVTFRKPSAHDYWLEKGLCVKGLDVPVTRDGVKVTVLYLRDLPHEIHADDLHDFFSDYGDVLTMERSTNDDDCSVYNGNRVIKMILQKDLPYFLTVFEFECRLWYREQPIQCFLCREHGHRAQSCPLSGRCRRCGQSGHVARECSRNWDPISRAAVVDPSNVPVDPSSVPEPDPVVHKPPVDVVAVDPVAVDPVAVLNVPVTNNSPISEPVASEMVSFKDGSSSRSSSLSSGTNSDVLGSSGVDLFRQNLMTSRENIEQDILDRATEDLADAVSNISRASFLKLTSSGLEKFVMNAFKTKGFAKNSRLSHVMVLSVTKLQKVLRNT